MKTHVLTLILIAILGVPTLFSTTAIADPLSSEVSHRETSSDRGCPSTANRKANISALTRGNREGSVEGSGHGPIFEILVRALLCALNEVCKTPCEELEEVMEQETGESPYGAVGCYDGEVLICVFPENFSHEHDDEDGAAIAKECIQAHEDAHGEQCVCDEDGQGLHPPENDLKSSENEGGALAAEIECYDDADCSNADDPAACQAIVDEFQEEACEQYETATGAAHEKC